ncbi:MAG: hypothetical protein HOQ22_03585 [Nocardioidaceae bacterium]|nr:hypothetical protein [Nocardioidaceae bacterium]
MRPSSRLALVGAVSALALSLGTGAASATGHDVIRNTLTPSLPTDPAINGVPPGGKPWIIGRGEVRVRDTGRMDVRIRGLQIPNLNGDGVDVNPVGSINALLFCDGMLTADSGPHPMTVPGGNARFRVNLPLSGDCENPSVLISPTASGGGAYIASAVGSMG